MEKDHQMKLRIANAIHTAMVYFMVRRRRIGGGDGSSRSRSSTSTK